MASWNKERIHRNTWFIHSTFYSLNSIILTPTDEKLCFQKQSSTNKRENACFSGRFTELTFPHTSSVSPGLLWEMMRKALKTAATMRKIEVQGVS